MRRVDRNLTKYGMVRGKIDTKDFTVKEIGGSYFSAYKHNYKLTELRKEKIYSARLILEMSSGNEFRLVGKQASNVLKAFYPNLLFGDKSFFGRTGNMIVLSSPENKKGAMIGENGEYTKRIQRCLTPFGITYVRLEGGI